MRTSIAFVLLLSLAACSPPRGQDAAASMSPDEIGNISDAASKAHALELKAMQAHPGYATRQGTDLTISVNSKAIARLSDGGKTCGGNCVRWTFDGVETLQSSTGVETYASVIAEDDLGFYRYTYIGSEHGLTWFNDPPHVSPNGQYVASGNLGSDPDSDGQFSITDWSTPYPHTVYDFGVGCEVGEWRSEREVHVTCAHPAGYSTAATVALFGDHAWRLTVDEHRTSDGKKIKEPILFPKATHPQAEAAYGLVWLDKTP